MASETRVNDDLLFMFGLRKLDQEYFRGEVVDIGDSKGEEGIRELVGNDLRLLAICGACYK